MKEEKPKRKRGRPRKNPEVKSTSKPKVKKKPKVKEIAKKTVVKKVISRVRPKKSPINKKSKLHFETDKEIATDFSIEAYRKFKDIIKAVVLFGSIETKTPSHNSDIDIMMIIDDISVKWDEELIAWYREELEKLLLEHDYVKKIHVNTIKLSTWWDDIMKGDPVVLNVLRHGQVILDYAGFFTPLKYLLMQGKIKGTPEGIYQCVQRAPSHLARSRASELAAVEGVYWSMVDSAHAALMAAGYFPPSPEHVMIDLKNAFVDKGMLKMKYALFYRDIYKLHKKIEHREIWDIKGVDIDKWQDRAEDFMKVMFDLVEKIVKDKNK